MSWKPVYCGRMGGGGRGRSSRTFPLPTRAFPADTHSYDPLLSGVTIRVGIKGEGTVRSVDDELLVTIWILLSFQFKTLNSNNNTLNSTILDKLGKLLKEKLFLLNNHFFVNIIKYLTLPKLKQNLCNMWHIIKHLKL